MEIVFRNRKLEKQVNDSKKLQQKYGKRQSEKIIQRINEFRAAKTLHDISKLPQARLHELSGNLQDHYAVDVIQPYRIIIKPLDGESSDLENITKIQIDTIEDYH